MTDASGGPAPSQDAAVDGPVDAPVGVPAPSRTARVLEIATLTGVSLNLLALAILGALGAAAVGLQSQVSQDNAGTEAPGGGVAGYWLALGIATVVLNGLAIWQRRSWGLGWAALAAVACWIVFFVAMEVSRA